MSSEEVFLKDIVEFNPSYSLNKGEEYKYVEMAAIPEGVKEIDYFDIKKYKGGSRFKNGETLFARITPCLENGKTAQVNVLEDNEVGFGSTEFIVLRPTEPEVDKEFVYYLCRHPEFRLYAQARMEGTSGRQRVSWQSLEEYDRPLPNKNTRKEVGEFLKVFDDKIHLNQQTNETLEAMAQAIFKSWFVDFDPVRAKIEATSAGRDPNRAAMAAIAGISLENDWDETEAALGQKLSRKSDKQRTHLRQTAELFPDELVESEIGEVPKGWGISEIGKEVNSVGGTTPRTKNPEYWDGGKIAWTTPKDLSNANSKILLDTDRKITDEGLDQISSGLLPIDTVLMSSRAPVGYLALAKIPVAINQGYVAMICDQVLTPEYVLHWTESNMDMIKQHAGGSTFSEISKRNFRPLPVLVPSEEVLNAYSEKVGSLYDLITANMKENITLENLRDTLLPKLISGKVGV